MINFINDEISMKQVDLQSIGMDYKVQYDGPDYALFTMIHSSQTSIGVLKVFKHINQYQMSLLMASDFGVYSLYIQNYFAFYKSDENILVIFLVNTITNTLNLYRGLVDLENYALTKMKTINDSISLKEVNKLIWKIVCRNQM
jgi:hypothetical protein